MKNINNKNIKNQMLQQKFQEIGELIAEAVKNGNYKVHLSDGIGTDYVSGYVVFDDADKNELDFYVNVPDKKFVKGSMRVFPNVFTKEFEEDMINRCVEFRKKLDIADYERQIAYAQTKLAELKGDEQ